jgi:uncharacterized protein YjdB
MKYIILTAACMTLPGCESELEPIIVSPHSIEIISPAFTIDAGRSARIAYVTRGRGGEVVHGARIVWSSSDTTIARVDTTGTVTAVAPGAALITATINTVSDRVQLHVSLNGTYPGSVVLSPSGASALVGRSVQITAATNPIISTARFSWRSSNPNVATVDSAGVVTARAIGSTIVSARWVSDTTLTAQLIFSTVVPLARD